MSKPKLLVLHGKVNFLLDTYAESSAVREKFEVSKSTTVRGGPDVVFCQAFGQCADQILRCKRPVVVHVGGNPWLEMRDLRLKKLIKMFRKCKLILCPSQFMVNEFKKAGIFSNVRKYPAGLWGFDHTFTGAVPSRFRPKTDWEMRKNPIITMGINLKDNEITERKWRGIPIFIKAVDELLTKHKVRIRCFGRGAVTRRMKWADSRFTFRRAHHLDDKVDRWPFELSKADIFVHPSMYDVWGRTVADAMCAAVPSLVFDATAPPEVGKTTVKCDPSNVSDIRTKFERLLTDAKWRKELGRAHRKEAIQLTMKHANDLRNFLLEACK